MPELSLEEKPTTTLSFVTVGTMCLSCSSATDSVKSNVPPEGTKYFPALCAITEIPHGRSDNVTVLYPDISPK
ncbi:hypothetical protein Barb6_00513 [Bacteroidales bacterium Barb6]|nr:hypothetical protein Barb6_00513 [Bacteroidales bacterium Barb6]